MKKMPLLLARMLHKLTHVLAGLLFRMEVLFGRAYELLRRSFSKLPHKTKSCAITMRIYATSGLVLAALISLPAQAGREVLNPDFVEDETKPWEEIAASLPAYPKAENLLVFSVSSATANVFMIDAASLSVGSDDVIRYTVVIDSPRGARTVNYEGMRCDPAEYKIYGFGQAGGKWTENKRGAWQPYKLRSLLSYHKALFEDHFCPDWIRIRDAKEGVRNLKRGRAESFTQ